MATVRFSRELIGAIEKNAKAKMQPAVDRAKEQRPDNKWGQVIYDTMFSEVLHIINQIPKHWVKQKQSFTIEKVCGTPCVLEFKFVTPIPWPSQFVETELAKQHLYWDDKITLKDHPVWHESTFAAEVNTYTDRIRMAQERQTEFVEMVKEVIRKFTTLAPALKAWPPLWELIPDDVKDKHRQVVEREKKEVVLEVDLGKLTALSTAAKFGI